ncbi:hypothetical protein M9H77_20179 [Catharanthus roseus]|uniref:Uncharacterized protein n=1 Tax=Catharanthus roseus TaxID=4058 RepID=A0ACC0AMZ1_CATRO|nr:hypothetical protein M9H77_20179 [Catharanthus roseus]
MQMQALSSASSSIGLLSGVGNPPLAPIRVKTFCYGPGNRSITRSRVSCSMATSSSTTSTGTVTAPKWAQKTITIPAQKRGCHLITSKILKEIGQELSDFQCGLAHLFLQHTSASLTINENYDSDVRDDTETFLNRVVPEGRTAPWKHTMEGPDDMPAHIKSSMFGCALTVPITNGRLNMGTWQVSVFQLILLLLTFI